MKKSTIFALILLVAGAACCITAVRMGAGDVFADGAGLRAFQYRENAADIALPDNVGDVQHLTLDIDSAELMIQPGDSWSLSGGKSAACEINGDTLTIKQRNPSGWWYKSKPATVTLTVPASADITSIDIDVDTGAVTVSDITAAQYITCEVDTGSVTMKNMMTGQLQLDCDVGGIEFSGEVNGPVKLGCDLGNIDVELQNGSTVGHVTGQIDVGNITVCVNGQPCVESEGTSKTISADLPGALGDDLLTIDCDAGNVTVFLTAKTIDEAETA